MLIFPCPFTFPRPCLPDPHDPPTHLHPNEGVHNGVIDESCDVAIAHRIIEQLDLCHTRGFGHLGRQLQPVAGRVQVQTVGRHADTAS